MVYVHMMLVVLDKQTQCHTVASVSLCAHRRPHFAYDFMYSMQLDIVLYTADATHNNN